MENTKVGTREFRVGLAEYIASDKPVAVTRHEAVMPLGDGEVDALAADFKLERKAAPRRKRYRRDDRNDTVSTIT